MTRGNMDLQLSGRTGMVTGASSGIGRRIAYELACEGVRLVVTARRRQLLEELASEIADAGGVAPVVIAEDITEAQAPARLAAAGLDELGVVQILVNNAGTGGGLAPGADEAQWEVGMVLNFTAHRQLTDYLLPPMRDAGWGRIITIGSGGNPAKAALLQHTRNVALQAARFGITANSVQPGRIMSEQIARRTTPEFRARLADSDIAIGEYGTPQDMAHVVCFLASPLARYITGAVIPVDGGLRRPAAFGKSQGVRYDDN
jgi:3-oxoacyl-[acyl-carrier protein] reductase